MEKYQLLKACCFFRFLLTLLSKTLYSILNKFFSVYTVFTLQFNYLVRCPVALNVKNSGRSRKAEILFHLSLSRFFFNHKILGACISGEIFPPTYLSTSCPVALMISASFTALWSSHKIIFLFSAWSGDTDTGLPFWSIITKEQVASNPMPRMLPFFTLLHAFYFRREKTNNLLLYNGNWKRY